MTTKNAAGGPGRPGWRAALFVLLCAVGLLPLGAPAASAAAPLPAVAPDIGNSPALANLSACLAEKKQGDLVLLMDTSGSLGTEVSGDQATDPNGVRVDAAQVLLDRLAASQARSGASIDVALVGFSSDYTMVKDFTALTPDQLPSLSESVAQFRDLDKGFETDFWTALTSLSATMAQRAADRSACQFFIWFTDGEFTLGARDGVSADDPRTPPATDSKQIPGYEGVRLSDDAAIAPILEAAKGDLCRQGGVADALRLAGITTIAIGLGGNPGATGSPDFGLLQRISENQSGDCGAQPARGLFVAADSLSSLFLAFDAIGDPTGSVTPLDSKPICPPQAPPDCGYTVQLDDVLSTVHVAAAVVDSSGAFVPSNDLLVELTGPGGPPPLQIPGGTTTVTSGAVGPVTVQYRWYPQGPLTIDLARPPGTSWAGNWTLKFIDTTGQHSDAVSNIQLVLSSDLMTVPQIASGPWRADGVSPQVVAQVERLDGTPDNLDTPELRQALTVTAALIPTDSTTAAVTQTVDANSGFTFALPADLSPGAYLVQTSLVVTVAGRQLAPVTRQTSVTVVPPPGSPFLDPAIQLLDFGLITGTATSGAQPVVVAAPDDADGCVWITNGELQRHPESIQSVVIGTAANSAATCQRISAGQTVEVPVTLTPGAEGNDELDGTVTVFLAPADDVTRVSQSSVNYTAMTIRTAQGGVKVGVFLVVMLLGLLIPLLTLWLLRRLSARFPAEVALSAIALNARIGPSGLLDPTGSALVLPVGGWQAVGAPTEGRRVLHPAGVALRARAGWRLSQPGYAEVVEDAVGAGGSPPHFDPKSGRPRAPLSVQGSWIVLTHRAGAVSAAADIPARVLLVVSSQADDGLRAQILGAAVRDAARLMAGARRAAAAAAGGGPQSGVGVPVPVGAPAGAGNPFAESAVEHGWPSGRPGAPAVTERPNPFGSPPAGGQFQGPHNTYSGESTGGTDDPWGRSR